MAAQSNAQWIIDTGCIAIDTDESSAFFRIWLACALFGALLATSAVVPYYMCSNRRDPLFEDPRAALPPRHSVNEAFVDDDDAPPQPDIGKARNHLKRSSPLDEKGRWRSVWSTSMGDLNEIGGIGVELYFRLLRSLGICFAYMGALSLPLTVFSWNGNFAPDVGSAAVKSAAGNLGLMAPVGFSQEDRMVVVNCQGVLLRRLTPLFAWLDMAGILLFVVFVAFFHFHYVPKATKEADSEHVSCKDFAVQIECLPSAISEGLLGDRANGPREGEYEQNLSAHIFRVLTDIHDKEKGEKTSELKPQVCEVSMVRDFQERLGVLKGLAQLRRKNDIAKYKGEDPQVFFRCRTRPLQEKIDSMESHVKKTLQPVPRLSALRAYVILNSPEDKLRLLTAYRFANFWGFRLCQSRALRFQGKGIKVTQAPEPMNIYWEHQDVPWRKRFFRKIVMFVVWFVVMLVGVILIFLSSSAAKSAGTSASNQQVGSGDSACAAGRPSSDGYKCDALVAGVWTKSYARTLGSSALACFCTSKGYTQVLQDDELMNDICKTWLSDASLQVALGFCCSILVVIINGLLQVMFCKFAEMEKPISISALNSSIMVKVSVSQFFNTAVIIFCLHYYGGDSFFPFNVMFRGGDFADFERGWYAIVGATVIVNMLLNSFTSAGVNLAKWFYLTIRRCSCFAGRWKHQAELLDVYTNPPFSLSARYAQILTTCFCTLTYSAGLPVLNIFAAMYFFIAFWVDKFLLLRGSRRPPTYDTQMPVEASGLLLYASVLHLFVAIFMFSHDCTFPSDPLGGSLGALASKGTDVAAVGAGNSTAALQSSSGRATRESTWMLFVLLVLLLAAGLLHLLKWLLGSTLGCMSVFTFCCRRQERTLPVELSANLTWDIAAPHIERIRPPASYMMEHNRMLGLSRSDLRFSDDS